MSVTVWIRAGRDEPVEIFLELCFHKWDQISFDTKDLLVSVQGLLAQVQHVCF